MKISIIVPIYNVEKYLCKCVDSLLCQDLSEEEYEIILVDDGSPDNCGKIADEYAAIHHNIRVIHQENGGLSAARNTGIDAASGDFVQFVDSDDYLEPNVLGELLNQAEKEDLDVLRFNYQTVNENYQVYSPNKRNRNMKLYHHPVCNGIDYLNKYGALACYAVQYILKSSLIKPTKNRFRCGIWLEDTEWTGRTLRQAQRIGSTEKVAYNYLQRQGSICNAVTIERERQIQENKISVAKIIIQQQKEHPEILWYKMMLSFLVLTIFSGLIGSFYSERKEYIKRLRAIDGIFPLSYYRGYWKDIIKYSIINISPMLFCKLFRAK